MDDLACSAALGARTAGLCHAKGGALRCPDGACSLAVRADLGRCPGSAAGTVAVRADLHPRDIQLLLAAESRFLEADIQLSPDTLAAARCIGITGLCPAPEAEDIPEAGEDIAEVTKASAKAPKSSAAKACVRIKGRMPELVILLAFVRIGEHLISFIRFLETLFRRFVAGVKIRVVLLGDLPVCFFYLISAGILPDAKHLIVISLFCHSSLRSSETA